jgi:hypothetical protein
MYREVQDGNELVKIGLKFPFNGGYLAQSERVTAQVG